MTDYISLFILRGHHGTSTHITRVRASLSRRFALLTAGEIRTNGDRWKVGPQHQGRRCPWC